MQRADRKLDLCGSRDAPAGDSWATLAERQRAGGRVRRTARGLRGWVIHALVDLHYLLWRFLRLRPRRSIAPNQPRTIVLTGKFFSQNWVMNHLRPLAGSDRCSRIWIVCTLAIPATRKVVHVNPPQWVVRVFGETPARLLVFAWVAVRHRPDVVGGFHLLVNGIVASLVGAATGARSLYICGGGPREVLDGGIHGNRVFAGLGGPDPALEGKLIRAVSCSDFVVTMGHRAVQFFCERGVRSRFAVIPGGIEGQPERSTRLKSEVYDLILVGRLGPVKRVDLFLKAVKCLIERLPQTRAVVVGGGDLESSLRELAENLGVSRNVEFVGHQTDVMAWLCRARVFVLTSDSEGLSLALMEAMACGLPAVVSDVGELGELVTHGVNGYLVRERTGAAFAARIGQLLEDPALQARMSAAALAAVQNFTLERTTERWSYLLTMLDPAQRSGISSRAPC